MDSLSGQHDVIDTIGNRGMIAADTSLRAAGVTPIWLRPTCDADASYTADSLFVLRESGAHYDGHPDASWGAAA